MKKVLAISGSTRKNSSNEALLHYIKRNYRDQLEMEIFDSIDKLPHFNPELDTLEPPDPVREFREKIEEADGLLICTPEYVFSLPGSLKNAIEWNVSTVLFSNKPTAIIVASASGQKAFESLELVMSTLEAKIADDSKLLIQGVKGKFDSGKNLTDDQTKNRIGYLMDSFILSMQ